MAFKFPRVFLRFRLPNSLIQSQSSRGILGDAGSGVGGGGGTGGSIRDAGGSFGKYATVKEEEYFLRKQREQLLNLKKKLEVDRNKMVESQQNEGPESGGTLSKIGEDEKLCIETLMKDRVFLLQKLEEYEEQVKYHQKEIQRDLDTVEKNVEIISQYKEVIGLLKSMLEISKQFPE